MPYYLFFMVTVSVLFSSHSSYKSLRNSLFPHLHANDSILRPVSLSSTCGLHISTWRRYICLQTTIVTLVAINCTVILFGCNKDMKEEEEGNMYSGWEKGIIITCEVLLYCIQIFALSAGLAILRSLYRASKAKPTCVSKKCREDDDTYLCEECSELVKKLIPGIKKIVCAFSLILIN